MIDREKIEKLMAIARAAAKLNDHLGGQLLEVLPSGEKVQLREYAELKKALEALTPDEGTK